MEDLPTEMLCNIFKYLSIKDALNVSGVNKYFRELMSTIFIQDKNPFVVTSKTRYFLNCMLYVIHEDIDSSIPIEQLKCIFKGKYIKCLENVTNVVPFIRCASIDLYNCKKLKYMCIFHSVQLADISGTGLYNFKAGPMLKNFVANNNNVRINFEGFPKRMMAITATHNDIEEIKSLEVVAKLCLDHNSLTSLGSIKRVMNLSLNYNPITTISGLPNLKFLRANFTELTTLDLDTPKTLEWLEIAGTRLPNLDMLVAMSNLEYLGVDKYSRSVKVVEYLSNLKILSIFDSGLLDEFVDVSNLKNLKKLMFSRNVVGFEKLVQLEELSIDSGLLQFQEILDGIKLLTNLKKFDVMNIEDTNILLQINIQLYIPNTCVIACYR